jgi:quaternary ammonium compound-resistance protein SugE
LPGTFYSDLMAWFFLVLGGLFEVAFAFSLGKAKETQGSPLGWYAAFALFAAISFSLLNKSLQQIPLGTAYAVWTGIGAVGTALLGIFFFRDPLTFWRLFFLATLVASVVGLKFASH